MVLRVDRLELAKLPQERRLRKVDGKNALRPRNGAGMAWLYAWRNEWTTILVIVNVSAGCEGQPKREEAASVGAFDDAGRG